MKTKTHENLRSLKWLVAIVVFVLAMTIAWADVYGTPTGQTGDNHQITQIDNSNSAKAPANQGVTGDDDSPTTIPEPTTWILLGGGLSALYVIRLRRRARQQG